MMDVDVVCAEANGNSDQMQVNKVSPFVEEERSEFTLPPAKIEAVTPQTITRKLATFTPRRVLKSTKKRFRLTFGTKKKKNNDNRAYEVECITNKRVTDGKLFYRVKWKGFKTQDWVPPENLMCDDLVREFEQRIKERLGHKRSAQSSSPMKKRAARARDTRSATSSSKMSDELGSLFSAELRPQTTASVKSGDGPKVSKGTASAASATKNGFLDMLCPADDVVVLMSEEQPAVCYADWNIVAVRPGSFPDQGPMAHLHNTSTDAHAYVSTAVLMRQCPQQLCTFYEKHLKLRS